MRAERAFPGVADDRGLRLLPVPVDLPRERGARASADVAGAGPIPIPATRQAPGAGR